MRILRNTVLVGVLAAWSSCGGSGDITRLTGAGATFPNLIYQKWVIDYNSANPNVQLNYQSIGSGGGVRQFSDQTVDFGGTDAPMTDGEISAINGNVYHVPTVLGAVVPTYNLPDITEPLRLTPEALAGIYLGEITRWNDPRIATSNPNVVLPDQGIVVAYRADGAGTTFIWTDYLAKVSPAWRQRVGVGKSIAFPVGLGARGNEGVTATVQQTPGAIGYVELGYAHLNQLPAAFVQNGSGNFIEPTLASVTAAAAGAMSEIGPDTDFRVSLTNAPGAEAYPIASFTWLLLRKEYADAAKAKELLNFVWWALMEGKDDAAALGYAPIPAELAPWISNRLQSVTVDGSTVWSETD